MLNATSAQELTQQSIQTNALNAADERKVFIKMNQEEYDASYARLLAEIERYVLGAAKQGKYATEYWVGPLNYRGKQDMEHVRANKVTRYAIDEIIEKLKQWGYDVDFEASTEPLPIKIAIQWSRRRHVPVPLESFMPRSFA